jgi:chromosomal replication initiator protein
LNVPARTLISPLAEGTFALDLANGTSWASQFVCGPENALVGHAVEELFTADGCRYNPLVLHGPAGVGKSHLAWGVTRRFEELHPTHPVIYESGADFARGYAEAVESRGVLAWREERRAAALMVIDEIGDLSGKSAAQIELLHTIDTLIDAGHLLVVTSRCTPARTPHLLPALVSRLVAGLVAPVAFPSAAARLTLLRAMAVERDLPIDENALRLLAEEMASTVPELSGALFELAANLDADERINHKRILSYLGGRPANRQATLREIASHTARYYALAVADLRGPSRRQNIVLARAVAMFIARQLTNKSFGAVGKYFGGRDHTTVLHGCRKTEELIARDPTVRQSVQELRTALSGF